MTEVLRDLALVTPNRSPRGPQAVMVTPIAVDLALRAIDGDPVIRAAAVDVGIGVLLVTTAAALLLPWRRLPPHALVAVPFGNLLAFGLLRLEISSVALGIVFLLPCMYLGRIFGQRGGLYALVGAMGLYGLPGFLTAATAAEFGRTLAAAGAGALLGAMVGATSEEWDAQREETERHRRVSDAIFRTVDVGLVLLDAEGRYLVVNPRHREFLDLAYPAGHGGRAGQTGAVFAEDRVTELKADEMPTIRATRGEEFSNYTIWIGATPESRRALSVSARSVLNDDGQFIGSVLAYKDVSDAMQALAIKDEFVALVSHELRTPLTSIMGFLDVVLDDHEGVTEENLAHLLVVERNATRLMKLVTDLLHTATADQGQLEINLTPAPLADLVLDAVEEVRRYATDHAIALETRVAVVPPVLVDMVRMTQVVHNLVTNGVKYSHPGETVVVSLSQQGDRAVLTVEDHGIGMSPEDAAQVFSKFFRSKLVSERAIQGVGLGLAITKTIVAAHDGEITVDSQEGVGTTMTVCLPLAPAEVEMPTTITRVASLPGLPDGDVDAAGQVDQSGVGDTAAHSAAG